MRSLISTRRRKVTALFAVLALAASGVALAAWLLHSRGNGRAQVGQLQNVDIQPGTPQGDVFPGSTVDAQLVLNNPNAPLKITAVEQGDGSSSSSNQSACAGSYLEVNPHALATPISVPNGQSTVVVPAAFQLASDAPSECQGVILTRNVGLTFSTP